MAATHFKTENNTLRKLIGNGLAYRIPRFQRDYSRTDDEWEDLCAATLSKGKNVFPGGRRSLSYWADTGIIPVFSSQAMILERAAE